jgi:hypothetical protein
MAEEEHRAGDRTRTMMRATLRDSGAERDACVLDLSHRGFMATATPAPRRGSYVELTVGQHVLDGQVQWSEGRRFGVRLRERIDVIAVLGNEAGPTLLKAAQKARGRASFEARAAYARHVGQGFTYGILLAVAGAGAGAGAKLVHNSLSAPFEIIEKALQPRPDPPARSRSTPPPPAADPEDRSEN